MLSHQKRIRMTYCTLYTRFGRCKGLVFEEHLSWCTSSCAQKSTYRTYFVGHKEADLYGRQELVESFGLSKPNFFIASTYTFSDQVNDENENCGRVNSLESLGRSIHNIFLCALDVLQEVWGRHHCPVVWRMILNVCPLLALSRASCSLRVRETGWYYSKDN